MAGVDIAGEVIAALKLSNWRLEKGPPRPPHFTPGESARSDDCELRFGAWAVTGYSHGALRT